MNKKVKSVVKTLTAIETKSGKVAIWQNVLRESSKVPSRTLAIVITDHVGKKLVACYVNKIGNGLTFIERTYYIIESNYSFKNGVEDLRTKVHRVVETKVEGSGTAYVFAERQWLFKDGSWHKNVNTGKGKNDEEVVWGDGEPFAFLTQAIRVSQMNAKSLWNMEKGTPYFIDSTKK